MSLRNPSSHRRTSNENLPHEKLLARVELGGGSNTAFVRAHLLALSPVVGDAARVASVRHALESGGPVVSDRCCVGVGALAHALAASEK